MALVKCEECGSEISSKAEACPKCGLRLNASPESSSKVNKPLIFVKIIGGFLVLTIIVAIFSSNNTTPMQQLEINCKEASKVHSNELDQKTFYENCVTIDSPQKTIEESINSRQNNISDMQKPLEISQSSPETGSTITKNEARAIIARKLEEDADSQANPSLRAVMFCSADMALDEVFSDVTELDSNSLESRLVLAMDHLKEGMKNKDSDIALALQKCAFDQNIKNTEVVNSTSLPLINIDDIKVDFPSLDGRRIRVQGIGSYLMNMFMLKKNTSDMSPMIVDITKLERDQKRKIIEQCSDIINGCRVTVHGTVGKVNYQDGIFAEKVEWEFCVKIFRISENHFSSASLYPTCKKTDHIQQGLIRL